MIHIIWMVFKKIYLTIQKMSIQNMYEILFIIFYKNVKIKLLIFSLRT
jgi:hypothetical protein